MFARTLLASAVLAALSVQVYAQESNPAQHSESDDYIEEITVTAQMREQSVMDVPVTMDVISGKYLERTNTMKLNTLAKVLPNVQIQEQGVSLPSFNIRGVTDDVSSVAATPRISVFQDGFDISKKVVASVALYDVNRVEVLKGPQPTLFGVAAANGAISIHSNLPTDEKLAKVQLGYNSENGQEAKFAFNTPISENNSFRIAGMYREMDGIIDNQACSSNAYYGTANAYDHNGNTVSCSGDSLQGDSVKALRGTWRADYDKIEIIARASMEKNDQPGISFKSGSIAPKGGDTSPFTAAEFSMGDELGVRRDLYAYDLSVDYQMSDSWILHADGYYKDVDLNEGYDADGSALRIQDIYFTKDTTLKGASTRFVYDSGDKLAAFFGASINKDSSDLSYYAMFDPYVRGTFDAVREQLETAYGVSLNQTISTDASLEEIKEMRSILVASLFNEDGTPISSPDYPPIMIQGPFSAQADLEINSYVAEVSYYLTDDLNVTAGISYIDETRYTHNIDAPANAGGSGLDFEAQGSFSDTLPRFALSYDYGNNWNFYANYARGRRSPVVDAQPTGAEITAAEIVDSYDVGFKFQSPDFTVTGAVFMYEYSDYQESYTDVSTLRSVTVTVGDSTMSGLETTATYHPDENFAVMASLAFLDAEFADETADGSPFQYGGNKFRLAPDVSGAINVYKKFPLGEWDLEANWTTSYQSDVYFESSNYPGLEQDGYSLTDASIKLSQQGSRFAWELYADNLFDEEYIIDAGNTGGGLGIPTYVTGMPQIFGVRFYADF